MCQTFEKKYVVHVCMHPIPPVEAFEKWGHHLMRALSFTFKGKLFFIIATNYLAIWVEMKPLNSSKMEDVAWFKLKIKWYIGAVYEQEIT